MIFRNLAYEVSNLSNPQQWLIDFFGGGPTYSGETISTENAVLNSNVYTCASILGGDIGKLPIQVFRVKGSGIEREKNHPAAYLLGTRPNPYMSPYTFKETGEVHLCIWGNFYANIEWDENGFPKALWPLNPSVTEVYIDPVSLEVWYMTTLPNGEYRKIPWYDIFHVKALSKTGLKGLTPVAVIREKLGIQQSSDKFIGAFYANGTASKGALTIPTPLDKDAKTKLKEEWQKINTGLTNAHRIAILDGGVDYKNIGMPLADAQFIETQKFGIMDVSKIYKIPGYKLGLNEVKYSNMEQQSLEYVKNALLPIVINWEEEINYKLFTPGEQKKLYSKFNLAAELRGDTATRSAFYKDMIQNGVYSPNEVRSFEELGGIGPAGDKHFIQLNMTTIETLEEIQKAKFMKGGGGNGTTGN
jgi:HK97 family phage portal protein